MFVCVYDGQGAELGRLSLSIDAPDAEKLADKFLRQHARPPLDATTRWNEAFAAAKKADKRVWVQITEPHCGPSIGMARWLDDQQKQLEADFVFLTIDRQRDLNGKKFASLVMGEQASDTPFHAMFDADQRMLISSLGPYGNIGFPGRFQGKRHLKTMLMTARQRINDKQIDSIIASLDNSSK